MRILMGKFPKLDFGSVVSLLWPGEGHNHDSVPGGDGDFARNTVISPRTHPDTLNDLWLNVR